MERPEIGLVKYRNDFLYEHGYYYCERCGRSNQYHYEIHHIFYRSEKPKHKHLNHKNNLILLCKSCHTFLHEHKPERQKLKKFYLAKELFYAKPDTTNISKA